MSFTYQSDDAPQERAPDQPQVPFSAPPIYTYILLGGIAAVALTQFTTGLEASILSAGFVKPAFLQGHEYWRILTGAATHGSIPHVLMNCYAFYSFGKIFEILANRAHICDRIPFVGDRRRLFKPSVCSGGHIGRCLRRHCWVDRLFGHLCVPPPLVHHRGVSP
ncbi:MAG: rhomboid family intramembrane serine protease [Pyrinomonadaceae bacterium]|nr:rhomboid family intramembrane serine protease [Pyrinomonadaceae bacterium]